MLNITENRISLTRGDTAYLDIEVKIDGNAYELQEDDTLTLTVKKKPSDTDSEPILIQKVIYGETLFHIEPSDTAELPFGKYKYDVQLNKANGDVFTIIEPTLFIVLEEVTC